MSKKYRNRDVEPKQQQEQEVQMPQERVVPLKRALSVWKKRNPQRAMFLDDAQAVELFVKRFIPSLEASQEEFDKIFERF